MQNQGKNLTFQHQNKSFTNFLHKFVLAIDMLSQGNIHAFACQKTWFCKAIKTKLQAKSRYTKTEKDTKTPVNPYYSTSKKK